MKRRSLSPRHFSIGATILPLLVFPVLVFASHSWGAYHWARAANPFTLKLSDNLSSAWDPFLGTTSSDWNKSSVLDTTIVAGGKNPRTCRPTNGRVEVCNYKYGANGWLGLAQIWVSGSHIYQGVTKVNDTYFTTAKYNTPAWKNLVMCQEIGHEFGLDHQDVNFSNSNLGTCMDYTSNPAGPPSNEHPNAHDYEQLEAIYAHLDSTTTVGQTLGQSQAEAAKGDLDDRKEWGKQVKGNNHVALFERELGPGHKLFTFVILAED